jgi:hypothetical protein
VAFDVIAIQAAFVVAVQVQSRLVVIASVPDIPSAGAGVVAATSTVTWHLTAVGADTEMDEDRPVHALEMTHSAEIANSRAFIGVPAQVQARCRGVATAGLWGSLEMIENG